MTNRKSTDADIGSTLTLCNDRGALFRGVVIGLSQSGAYILTEAVNLGNRWEGFKPEMRLVRGAEIVEEGNE